MASLTTYLLIFLLRTIKTIQQRSNSMWKMHPQHTLKKEKSTFQINAEQKREKNTKHWPQPFGSQPSHFPQVKSTTDP